MRRSPLMSAGLALAGIIVIVAACAQLKALPNVPASHPEALSAGRVSCAECHTDEQRGTLKAFASFNHTRSFVTNHRFYASSDSRVCSTCHKGSFCADCHTNQVEMKPSIRYGNRPDRQLQHRGDYLTLHKIEGKLDPAGCYRCHGRANNERCLSCHR